MKTKIKYIFALFLSLLVLCSALVFWGFCAKNNQKQIFAYEVDNIDSSVKIKNDGTILTSNLWKALKRYYEKITDESVPVDTSDNEKYITTNLFENFPVTTLDLSGNSDIDKIESLQNLKYFDLKVFTTVNLSGNKLERIDDELSNIENLQELNLSNNKLTSFSYQSLYQKCYNQTMQKLDISQNNIYDCDLSKINQGEIDAKQNNITKSKLTLPTNLDVKVYLSHNLIDSPDTSNSNIYFGFQGVKNQSTYTIGQKIYFFGIDELESINVFKLTYSGENQDQETETFYRTLNIGENLQFEIGYYRIKFADIDNSLFASIETYICPEAPKIKMFQNGKELEEITHKITTPAVIKFEGRDGANFIYSLNGSEYKEGNEVTINQAGSNVLCVYQVVDGYVSEGYSLYINYNPPITTSWIIIIAGIVLLAAMFYLAIKYMPALAKLKIGGKDNSNNNSKLD